MVIVDEHVADTGAGATAAKRLSGFGMFGDEPLTQLSDRTAGRSLDLELGTDRLGQTAMELDFQGFTSLFGSRAPLLPA